MIPTLDRRELSRGAALLSYKGGYFFAKEDISLDWGLTFADIGSSAFGQLDRIRTGVNPTIDLVPVGEFEHLSVLYAALALSMGASILGPTDNELLIQPLDTNQKQTRFRNAAIPKMPNLHCTTQGTVLEAMQFRMFRKNDYDPTADDALFIQEDNTLTTLPYDPTKVIVEPYYASWISQGAFTLTYGANTTAAIAAGATAATVATALNGLASITTAGGVTVTGSFTDGYVVTFVATGTRTNITGAVVADGSGGTMPTGTSVLQKVLTAGATGVAQVVRLRLSPWTGITTLDGFSINLDMSTTEIKNDALGVVDMLISDLKATCTATPQGINEILAARAAVLQGAASLPGKKVSDGANHLDIVGANADVYVRLYAANLTKLPSVYSQSKDRLGQVEWTASRSVGPGGTLNPLIYIGTSAPS